MYRVILILAPALVLMACPDVNKPVKAIPESKAPTWNTLTSEAP